jgi:transposase
MSLRPEAVGPVPEETARIAHAVFPQSNSYLRLRDELGVIYEDGSFTELFPRRGQPAEAPWRLAVATVLQFAEGLSDRQAADAVRSRIDWKYVLALELSDPGFDHTVLSEFRARLVAGQAVDLLLEALLRRVEAYGLVRTRGRQRTDSTHVLAAVRVLNRLERVGETLRAALNSLAVLAPDWLRSVVPTDWYQRYGERVEHYNLPKSEAGRREHAALIGADGQQLLQAIDLAVEQPWLQHVPAVEVLRRVWTEQYLAEAGALRWREVKEIPTPAEMISSPYDTEARYSSKRSVDWVGYKVHLTETCDPDLPHLIVHVETTPAAVSDEVMVPVVHAALARAGRLPAEHLVDAGYTDAPVMLQSRRMYGVSLIGPVADDPSWQARSGQGLTKADFMVDWDHQVVTCPAGKESISWLPHTYPGTGMTWEARFARKDCTPCPLRPRCTRAKLEPRIIGLQARDHFEALQAARRWQRTEEFRRRYAARAGIEATHAQAIRRSGLRQARYIGLAKTRLQHVATAAAVNILRISAWCAGTPFAKTRLSHFAAVQPAIQAK